MGRISLIAALKRWIKGMQPINIDVRNVVLAPNELLKGKNAIVTGAGSGIGLAIAKAFIASGAIVVGIGRNWEKLQKTSMEIASDNFIPYACDVANIAELQNDVNEICKIFKNGTIDILVNCAGVKNGNDERFFEFTSSEFDYIMDTNLKGVFFWSQEIAKRMIQSKIRGHIVNVISIKGFVGEASPYSLSKWGCVSLTKGLGRLLAPRGIIVNGLAPGGTKTPMAGKHADSWLHTITPSLRLADSNEMANIAVFLASDLGDNLVGEIVISDGGQSLQYGTNRI